MTSPPTPAKGRGGQGSSPGTADDGDGRGMRVWVGYRTREFLLIDAMSSVIRDIDRGIESYYDKRQIDNLLTITYFGTKFSDGLDFIIPSLLETMFRRVFLRVGMGWNSLSPLPPTTSTGRCRFPCGCRKFWGLAVQLPTPNSPLH